MHELSPRIAALDRDKLNAFREWFSRFDADAWDRQIESDATHGKLAKLAEQAIHDYRAGRSTDL